MTDTDYKDHMHIKNDSNRILLPDAFTSDITVTRSKSTELNVIQKWRMKYLLNVMIRLQIQVKLL